MPLKVLPATEADAFRAATIEEMAYGPNPLDPVLFPGPLPSEPNTRAPDLINLLQKNPACRWAKVVDTDLGEAEDQMIAFSSWYLWETTPTEEQHSFPSQRGPRSNAEACELFFGGMNKMRVNYMKGTPYAYPKHQRRGAASLLLEYGLKESDRLGIPACLESSAEGRKLYEKFGFEEVDRLTVDFSRWGGPSDVTIPLMVRPEGGRSTPK
ncbi:GCN5-related N-acetyltransferase (GNAT) domain-containing protein [Fusarium austroafricanum]|uniref:GCN5-related N-acetyltransferase (GNAT) domain-containing protein n=1 Tax=Fusarium austroafricanum TaxID=2364996 RepID=A0A8H4KK53_9HYPO|nr:GCN5-related N-acetyltransferase (GNAT) domain-containing protein [Fusarium austroafricanum]